MTQKIDSLRFKCEAKQKVSSFSFKNNKLSLVLWVWFYVFRIHTHAIQGYQIPFHKLTHSFCEEVLAIFSKNRPRLGNGSVYYQSECLLNAQCVRAYQFQLAVMACW